MPNENSQLEKISKFADETNNILGRIFAWLSLGIVLVTFLTVIERYLFGSSEAWQNELIRYMHAALFLGAAGYALKHDSHVRVDIFYLKFSDKGKALVNLLGCIFLLIPFILTLTIYSWSFVSASWAIAEGSREFNGLGAVYILKSFILLFCFTLLLQSISIICNSIIRLRS